MAVEFVRLEIAMLPWFGAVRVVRSDLEDV